MALRIHLDTNAYAAYLRGRPEAVFIVERAPTLVLSPIVIGELKAGFLLGTKARDNGALLDRFLSSPRTSVPPMDERVTDAYARIFKQLRLEGTPIPTNDLWIAACVLAGDEVLYSYDSHFDRVDHLRVVRSEAELSALLR